MQKVRLRLYLLLKKIINLKARSCKIAGKYVTDKVGLEIGGYSPVFASEGDFPVYPLAGRMDNCQFSFYTHWQKNLKEGFNFRFAPEKDPGYQYILDGTGLSSIGNDSYDFVLSCHCLEHIANPLLALHEWLRVLKPGGVLILILPLKDMIFDHNRPTTSFEHILDDYTRGCAETDLTHLEEILELHDQKMYPLGKDKEDFRRILAANETARIMHHHTFDKKLIARILNYLNMEILGLELFSIHVIAVARKKDISSPGLSTGSSGKDF